MITSKSNYVKFSKLLNMNLVNNSNLALDLFISANILTIGCLKGSFTSRKLSDYIKLGNISEFISARKVVNGIDKNSDIATYAEKFLQCLVLKSYK